MDMRADEILLGDIIVIAGGKKFPADVVILMCRM